MLFMNFSTNKIMEINATTSKEKIVRVKVLRLVFPENITFRYGGKRKIFLGLQELRK